MYPRNAASPERIAIGAVVLIADGTVQTAGVAVKVVPFGATESTGGGTVAYSADGVVLYTPTQAETNYTSIVFIASKSACIPASATVVTSAAGVAGQSYVGVVATDAITAAAIAADAVTEIQNGLQSTAVGATVERSTADTGSIRFSWPVSGATITGDVSIDYGAYATMVGAVASLITESGKYWYTIAHDADDRPTAEGTARYKLTDGTYTRYVNLRVEIAAPAVGVIQDGLATQDNLDNRTLTTAQRDILATALKTASIGSVAAGATTSSLPIKALSPSSIVNDQYKGLILKFTSDTATTALRGQGTDITASTTGVLTVTTLTTAPSEDDSFIIQ